MPASPSTRVAPVIVRILRLRIMEPLLCETERRKPRARPPSREGHLRRVVKVSAGNRHTAPGCPAPGPTSPGRGWMGPGQQADRVTVPGVDHAVDALAAPYPGAASGQRAGPPAARPGDLV